MYYEFELGFFLECVRHVFCDLLCLCVSMDVSHFHSQLCFEIFLSTSRFGLRTAVMNTFLKLMSAFSLGNLHRKNNNTNAANEVI